MTLLTALWKGLIIRGEILRDREAGATESIEEEEVDSAPLTEISSVWVGLGVVATSTFSVFNIVYTITSNKFFEASSTAFFPIAMVLYCLR